MTVGELRRAMTPGEYLAWTRFYAVKAQKRQLAEMKARG